MEKLKMVFVLSLISICAFSQVIDLNFNKTIVKEGDQAGDFYTAEIRLSSESDKTVSVTYQTKDGSAVAGKDYESVSGTVSFAPGETLKLIQFFTISDRVAEKYLEQFDFELSNPVNANLGKSIEVLTIEEDDIELEFLALPQVNEGKDGERTKAKFTVASKYSFGEDILLGIQTLAGQGSATAGIDYEIDYATIVIAGEQHQKSFEVTVLGDGKIEKNEVFAVQIWSNDDRVSIVNDTQEGYIIDDDGDLYFNYDINIKIFASEGRRLAVEGNASGESKLEKTQLDNDDFVFEGEITPLTHSSVMSRIGNLVTFPSSSIFRLYSTDGTYTADSMRGK